MHIEQVTLGPDGRIVIPIAARRELGLKSGQTLVVESDGTSLLIRSQDAVLQETQDYFREFVQPGISELDALQADRTSQAALEAKCTNDWLERTRLG